jgi:lactam utilization protein B
VRAVASLAVSVALAALASATTATAATPCDQQVLSDWFADGRVDRAYPLECYQVAVESLPSDLRDYTNAQEEIERALQSATRSGAPDARDGTTTSSSTTSFLVPALAAAATGVLAGGGVWLARRTRSARRHGR